MFLEKNNKSLSSKYTKHINICYFFITDRITKSEIFVVWCLTGDMTGDYMTNPLQSVLFRKFRDQIIEVVPAQNPGPGKTSHRKKKKRSWRKRRVWKKRIRIPRELKKTPIERSVKRKMARNVTKWFGHGRTYMTTEMCWSLTILKKQFEKVTTHWVFGLRNWDLDHEETGALSAKTPVCSTVPHVSETLLSNSSARNRFTLLFKSIR